MKVTFESEDPKEIKRLAKSLDMAIVLFELSHNVWRNFKHTDYDYEPFQEKINELLDGYNIDVEDLID